MQLTIGCYRCTQTSPADRLEKSVQPSTNCKAISSAQHETVQIPKRMNAKLSVEARGMTLRFDCSPNEFPQKPRRYIGLKLRMFKTIKTIDNTPQSFGSGSYRLSKWDFML
eukprot:5701679-Amphidinium_carterae.2